MNKFKNLKFYQIFKNNEKLIEFQIYSNVVSKLKSSYVSYFTNFYILLYKLKMNVDFIRNLYILYSLPNTFLSEKNSSILNDYIANRELKKFFFESKNNMRHKSFKKKQLLKNNVPFNKRVERFPFKIVYTLCLRKFPQNFYFFLVFFIQFRISSLFKQKKIPNFLLLYYLDHFLRFYRKSMNFYNLSSYFIFENYLKFLLFIGLNQLNRIIPKLTKNLDYYNLIHDYNNFLGFVNLDSKKYQSRKPFIRQVQLLIMSPSYRFWKKISTHTLFSCPVEKKPFFSEIISLPCGHVFSYETVNNLAHETLSSNEYFILTGKNMQSKFLDCPWCETIHEIQVDTPLISVSCKNLSNTNFDINTILMDYIQTRRRILNIHNFPYCFALQKFN